MNDCPFSFVRCCLICLSRVGTEHCFGIAILPRNPQLVEKLFHAFLDGFGEALRGQSGDKAKECCAVLYDAFFLLFGVTPENKAMEMLSITRNFKQQNLSGSAQAWREIVWLLDNYYKARPDLGETTRHLEDLVKLQLEKYEIRRFFSEAHPITDCLGQFLGGSGIQRSPPSYLQADGPFGLLLHEQSSETREPEKIPMQRQGSDQVVFAKIIYWDLEIARMSRIDHRSEVFFSHASFTRLETSLRLLTWSCILACQVGTCQKDFLRCWERHRSCPGERQKSGGVLLFSSS